MANFNEKDVDIVSYIYLLDINTLYLRNFEVYKAISDSVENHKIMNDIA